MTDERSTVEGDSGRLGLGRVGGLAIIVGMVIHIVLNVVLKEFPPENPTSAELQEYLAREASNWGVIHGFRYLAFTCIVLFAAGLFSRTCRTHTAAEGGWGVVGLLGAAIFVTNGFVTNGIEILAFLNIPLIAQNQDLFWLLFRLTRILFTVEVVTWSILILGFSVSGWRSATIPRWISVLGFVQVTAGMTCGVFIASALAEGWAGIPLEVASVTGLFWFLSTGVYLLVRGNAA
jgi:hypothetical protein